ncbi:hypothetical protein ES703_108120 [subsurface metagenome]
MKRVLTKPNLCVMIGHMNKFRLRGNQKEKRNKAVRYFEFEHPHLTESEIGNAFGIHQSTVSRILNKKLDEERQG